MSDNNINSSVQKLVVVIGDVSVDNLQHETEPNPHAAVPYSRAVRSRRLPEAHMTHNAGGAWLIADLLDQQQRFSGGNFNVFSYAKPGLLLSAVDQTYLEVTKSTNRKGGADPNPKKIYRVGKFVGSRAIKPPFPVVQLDDTIIARAKMKDACLLTIINAQDLFSDGKAVWSKQGETAKLVQTFEEIKEKRHFVILKSSWPLTNIVWSELLKLRDRLLIVLNGDDLRNDGLMISRGVSWDATASDMGAVLKSGAFKRFNDCHIVIRFGLDGAMYFKDSELAFFYDPAVAEGEFSRNFPSGTMSGFGSVFISSLAIDFNTSFKNMDTGIRQALVATRRLLEFGYKKAGDRINIDHYEVFDRSDQANRKFAKTKIENKAYDLSTKSWGFLNLIVGNDLESLATDIVYTGNIQPDRYGVPQARLGKLETLDRSEIESYRGIRNLLSEFMETSPRKVGRPLSIGVFGKPGTGKSFGVSEVARSLPFENIELGLVFNVAQFTSVADLTIAFHRVRDVALKSKVPIVFFDEFDAVFGSPLGWLKYFLAPMQDGVFKDGETLHPIGKAVLVFAGGRSYSFKQFCDQSSTGIAPMDEEAKRDAKLPDFISRLRGYVNIIGPNPTGDDDRHFIVRRAVTLRSLLIDRCGHLFIANEPQMDLDVVNAFLHAPDYRHGVRSMEALIEMSILSGKKSFDKSALPSKDQMDMHVNAEEFLKLVHR